MPCRRQMSADAAETDRVSPAAGGADGGDIARVLPLHQPARQIRQVGRAEGQRAAVSGLDRASGLSAAGIIPVSRRWSWNSECCLWLTAYLLQTGCELVICGLMTVVLHNPNFCRHIYFLPSVFELPGLGHPLCKYKQFAQGRGY